MSLKYRLSNNYKINILLFEIRKRKFFKFFKFFFFEKFEISINFLGLSFFYIYKNSLKCSFYTKSFNNKKYKIYLYKRSFDILIK